MMKKMIKILLIISLNAILVQVYSSRGCTIYYESDGYDMDYCKKCCSAGRFVTQECLADCKNCAQENADAFAEFKDFPG
jgi:hypothetical protein